MKLTKVAITQGDINGIGYEVIMKTLAEPRITETCIPIIYGSSKVAAYHRKALDMNSLTFHSISHPHEAHPKRINIINCTDENVKVELGKSTEVAGAASFAALEAACNDLAAGKVDVLVTAPINKENIQSPSFKFPGHTEYLMQKFQTNNSAVMVMMSEQLNVGVVTGHIPVSKIASSITVDAIVQRLRTLNHSMTLDFNIRRPRIAVLGLNPHAGDNGLIGNEDQTIVNQAVKHANREGILAFGPLPADGFFGAGHYKKYDVILAMYHDQGLIPFKLLAFDGGVNYTAGLPFVRTSPAHGTAYDIAGKNVASPDSFRQALYLACDAFKNRQVNAELMKNAIYNNKPIIPVYTEGADEVLPPTDDDVSILT